MFEFLFINYVIVVIVVVYILAVKVSRDLKNSFPDLPVWFL